MISRLLHYIASRWRKRSYAQTILREKPVAYYRLGQDVDYSKLKFPIGRSGVKEPQQSQHPWLNRPSNPALDVIIRREGDHD
jgi:hypothetical protein